MKVSLFVFPAVKWTKIRWAASLALMLGAFVLGCYPQAPASDWNGSICAAPENGGEFCVPSRESPAGAWNQAAAKGSMPIQMWVKWPQDMTLDELVESRDLLELWFADIDRVLAYVRDTKQSAESYKASMAGNLGTLLQQAKERQAKLFEQMPVDPAGAFKRAIFDKTSAEKSPLMATIATDKQAMAEVQAVFDKAKHDIEPLPADYALVVSWFAAYRTTEAEETVAYVALAQQASKADLHSLNGVEQAILKAAQDASAKPNDLVTGAMKLSAKIQAFEVSFQTAIIPHTEVLATHGATLPDMTSSALRSLNAMLGYVQQRVARSDATAMSLLAGVAMRRQALVLLETNPVKGAMVAQARQLKASTTFSSSVQERVAALGKTPKASEKLKLPYLAARYDELTALLQMEPLCDPSSSGWREAGCVSLRASFKAAESSLTTTLPMMITTGLATMRVKGVDAALLDAAQAKLNGGDVKGAAVAHDAALRSVEGT